MDMDIDIDIDIDKDIGIDIYIYIDIDIDCNIQCCRYCHYLIRMLYVLFCIQLHVYRYVYMNTT